MLRGKVPDIPNCPPPPVKGDYCEEFKQQFMFLQREIHEIAIKAGWCEEERNKGELIALMHSELSEALEYMRHGNPPSDHISHFSGVEEELADVIIRIMDFAEHYGMDVAGAVIAKVGFNAGREYKHGGKKF